MPSWLRPVLEKLERIEKRLAQSVKKSTYTVEEVALILGKSPWTVRQYCNERRVSGAYKVPGRGTSGEWRIPEEGLEQLRNEGPLPVMQSKRSA